MKASKMGKGLLPKNLKPEQLFMLSMIMVNAGNYFYNLLLGRILGPKAFADAAILITFLLVLSFVGMTFQIVTTKYCVELTAQRKDNFIKFISKTALAFGIIIGSFFIIFSTDIQSLLNTKSDLMFKIFGCGIPLYFLMSVNRGIYQGGDNLYNMSITYLTEMISRLVFTIVVILFVPNLPTTTAVASGISLSFIFGLFPFQKSILKIFSTSKNDDYSTKKIISFFALTAFYELTQIIINNSDVVLVKHYFSNDDAGLYSSLALIGRVVYFLTWMFVMMLLPRVIKLNQEGKNAKPILLKYISIISIFSIAIVAITYLTPQTVVNLMFGEQYVAIAPLLWKYALATAFFAISNVFAYYYLSMSNYVPVIISAILGCTQIILIVFYHQSLEQVVCMQQIAMMILLIFQLAYFFKQNKKSIRLN